MGINNVEKMKFMNEGFIFILRDVVQVKTDFMSKIAIILYSSLPTISNVTRETYIR
jgi:hypothetical protein